MSSEDPVLARSLKFYSYVTFAFISTTLALKAKKVVELGTGQGYSGGCFATALRLTGGKLYSVDINAKNDVYEILKDYKDIIHYIVDDSIKAGEKWDKGDIDILYCDSDHSYNRVLGELETWGRFNPKVVFIHDTLSRAGEKVAPYHAGTDYAKKYGKTFFNFSVPHGLGVII